MAEPLHILVLADRDWTHHDTGGNGTNLGAQILRWADWGNRVTMVTGSYPGAKAFERFGPNLEVHRAGGRVTVFPRAAWKVLRGTGREADVALEVINGITFLTPLWLRMPRLALVHHVHRGIFRGEFGPRLGSLLFRVLEAYPLRFLYGRVPFTTISRSARNDLVDVGVPEENVSVEYLGVEADEFQRTDEAREPRLVFVGRLKAYKRIENILDVLERLPGVALDIVGEGDHRPDLEAEIERRGLTERVTMHGYVDTAKRARLYGQAWVNLTASSSEGWSLTVIESALCGTPSAALPVGGLPESIIDGVTGVLASDTEQLAERVGNLLEDRPLRERLASAAEQRARTFSWDRVASANLELLRRTAGRDRNGVDAPPPPKMLGFPPDRRAGRGRGLAQREPGASSCRRREPSPWRGEDRRDRIVSRSFDDRARPGCRPPGRGGCHRPPRRRRPRSAGDRGGLRARRCRSPRVPRQPRAGGGGRARPPRAAQVGRGPPRCGRPD